MKQEVTATGKTVEAALAAGADMLGVDSSKVTYEIIDAPKKGFLGFGEVPAKLKVIYTVTPEESALMFVKTVLSDMGLDANAEISPVEGEKREYSLDITGEDAGLLIGHHGETLDALQYLANLAANRREEDGSRTYTRISVDIEGYRAKREQTLRQLAVRMAEKVLKYKKSFTLEPMSSYERRIIHSEIQNIEGVTTNSVGVDNNRRVVISLDSSSAEAQTKPSYQKRPRSRRPRSSEQKSQSASSQASTPRPATRPPRQERPKRAASFDEVGRDFTQTDDPDTSI